MQLKYTGPRPIISHTGVTFDQKKEDKFHYLAFAIELLQAVDHEYLKDATYTFEPGPNHHDGEEMLTVLRRFCPQAETEAKRRALQKRYKLDGEIQDAEQNPLLNREERDALVNNLKLMYDYRLQRTVNKNLYYSAISALASLIAKDGICYIKVPFRQEHYHVFHSLEGILNTQKYPLNTRLEIYEEKGELMVRLDVTSR